MSEWTVDTLREHVLALLEARHDQLDRRFISQDQRWIEHLEDVRTQAAQGLAAEIERNRLALDAAEKAIAKSEVSVEKRFDAVNEFRATLSDQQKQLLPRLEFDSSHTALIARMEASDRALQERLEAFTIAANEAHVGLERRIADNKTSIEQLSGQRAGSALTLTILVSIVGLLLTMTVIGLSVYAITKR